MADENEGKFFSQRNIQVRPFGEVDWHMLYQKGFIEKDSPIALAVRDKTSNMARIELGLVFLHKHMGYRYCLTPYLSLGWVRKWPIKPISHISNFVYGGNVMNVYSLDRALNFFSPELGLKWTFAKCISFYIGYKGEYGSKASLHEGEGKLIWAF